jgi:hypothetical protein
MLKGSLQQLAAGQEDVAVPPHEVPDHQYAISESQSKETACSGPTPVNTWQASSVRDNVPVDAAQP